MIFWLELFFIVFVIYINNEENLYYIVFKVLEFRENMVGLNYEFEFMKNGIRLNSFKGIKKIKFD